MKFYLGADHDGFRLKTVLFEHLVHSGHQVQDCGAVTLDADDDYPQYAYYVATKVLGEEADNGRGILLCDSGQGMSMAANRVRGIRAALAWNEDSARRSRQDDNSNVLVLPAGFIDDETAIAMVDTWIATEFNKDPKYHRRLDEMEELYG